MAASLRQDLRFLSLLLVAGLATSCSPDDCTDGADNDGDGLINSEDPGCELNGDLETPDPVLPASSDREDNDGGGLSDLDDPGCDLASDDDEADPVMPACRDGIDNDGDGLIEYPHD
ncbi:MAG: hypothetical protein GY811_10190, partial [Myxococcales bacterium]|nr:hypothetical protein [Myxococcales bacterium]